MPFLSKNPAVKRFRVENINRTCEVVVEGTLEVTRKRVIFSSKSSSVYWPLDGIREYGFHETSSDLFLFEAGRRCPKGEGLYCFRTPDALLIYMEFNKAVDEAMMMLGLPQERTQVTTAARKASALAKTDKNELAAKPKANDNKDGGVTYIHLDFGKPRDPGRCPVRSLEAEETVYSAVATPHLSLSTSLGSLAIDGFDNMKTESECLRTSSFSPEIRHLKTPANEFVSANQKTPANEFVFANQKTPANEFVFANQKTPANEFVSADQKTPANEFVSADQKTPANEFASATSQPKDLINDEKTGTMQESASSAQIHQHGVNIESSSNAQPAEDDIGMAFTQLEEFLDILTQPASTTCSTVNQLPQSQEGQLQQMYSAVDMSSKVMKDAGEKSHSVVNKPVRTTNNTPKPKYSAINKSSKVTVVVEQTSSFVDKSAEVTNNTVVAVATETYSTVRKSPKVACNIQEENLVHSTIAETYSTVGKSLKVTRDVGARDFGPT